MDGRTWESKTSEFYKNIEYLKRRYYKIVCVFEKIPLLGKNEEMTIYIEKGAFKICHFHICVKSMSFSNSYCKTTLHSPEVVVRPLTV